MQYRNGMSRLSLPSSAVNWWPVGGWDAPKKVYFRGGGTLGPLEMEPLSESSYALNHSTPLNFQKHVHSQ